MLIELMRFMTPARRSDAADGGVPDDALVTEEGEPEATDDGVVVRFEEGQV